MKRQIDYHIHTDFSGDSSEKMANYVQKAVELGYEELAFTEHFESDPQEIADYGIPPLRLLVRDINKLQLEYPAIKLKYGLEIGEYHRNQVFADSIISKYPPDVKIGSIHAMPGGYNVSVPLKFKLTDKEMKLYYEENIYLLESVKIDILGHLGIYARFLKNWPDLSGSKAHLEKLTDLLIKTDTALEINTSGLRNTIESLIPDPQVILMYLKKGGKLLTLGSDSHTVNDFDKVYNRAINILKDCSVSEIAVKEKNNWAFRKI